MASCINVQFLNLNVCSLSSAPKNVLYLHLERFN